MVLFDGYVYYDWIGRIIKAIKAGRQWCMELSFSNIFCLLIIVPFRLWPLLQTLCLSAWQFLLGRALQPVQDPLQNFFIAVLIMPNSRFIQNMFYHKPLQFFIAFTMKGVIFIFGILYSCRLLLEGTLSSLLQRLGTIMVSTCIFYMCSIKFYMHYLR